ncbi:MAG: cardiolipin synthase [Gemmatimonadota bacterium]
MSVHPLSSALLVSHWLVVVGLSLRVITRRPPIGVAMAWLAVVMSVPFVGAALYLFFGEKRLGPARSARIAATLPALHQWQAHLPKAPDLDPGNHLREMLAPHAWRALGFPPMDGNHLELLADVDAVFDRMVGDIRRAQHSVEACFYIWREDGRAGEVLAALTGASARGVSCRVLADATGSKPFLRGDGPQRLRASGVQVQAALPTSALRTLFARADLRNHRKILTLDGTVAYVGSQNLVDPRYFKQDAGVGRWVDAMVRMEGSAVPALAGVFALDWSVERGLSWEAPRSAPGSPPEPRSTVQVVPSGPDLQPDAIRQLLLTALYGARREIFVTTPYFVPDDALLAALLSAAQRDVDVILVVPAHVDSRLVRLAGVAHFSDLMAAGARIGLYEDGLLHTKSLTIDGSLSIFGSVNFDMRSLWLNHEISLFVYDAEFTSRLRALQAGYLESSSVLDPVVWSRRPGWRKLAEDTCRLLGPIL